MTIPRWPALCLALGVALFFDVLRVFLPSLITLFGRAGETPPELMGLYAAAWFVLPFLGLLLRPRWALAGGAVALVACLLVLQAGLLQLYASSVGVSAGLLFLTGCARLVPAAAVPVGLMGGLSFSVLIHLLLDGVDLVWRPGVLPWLAVAALCAAFLFLVRQALAEPGDPAPSRTWFLFGPALLIVGMAATSWSKAAAGPTTDLVTLALPGLLALCLLALTVRAMQPPSMPPFSLVFGILLVLLTPLTFLSNMAAPVAIVWVGELIQTRGANRRPGLAMLGGGLVFLVGVFGYYASYDLDLGFPNLAFPTAAALLIVGVGVVPELMPKRFQIVKSRLLWKPALASLVLVPLAIAATWQPEIPVRTKQGDAFTLITYNIRMGFGLDGRLSLDQIAAWAAARHPDVVLLSEVDRGWLLNGGHDDLARIARGLGMRYYFAPAADAVWGDALLTNLPVKTWSSTELGKHDYPTGAQAQQAVVEVGGKEVGIVNTHLQAPVGQAPEVADIVRKLAAERPVVVAGDLNTRPTDPQMRVLLDAGLSDPLLKLGNPSTSPADAPVERIDHVLISEGLEAVSAQAPRLTFSDHLPVIATLRLTSASQE
ncbi:endonuclease/exonuclease/phosphatase family protein [Nonomuraea sediminis]|uniref:endonuclease/exonuclease/phosphatase family protein n=1 Tax=Nonomuraea sediminis TaxID=2835864 RepID=UPI001BDC0B7D|nr:endonuclease/exonuclease/phosphatase family protein [Nonomuraea sediminis]